MTDKRADGAGLNDQDLRHRAVAAARGVMPFDLLIMGGVVADMVTGELREADIGVVGAMIASVHDRGARMDAARVDDARGQVVAPGLRDTHMHVESSMITPVAYCCAVVPRGVTTVVWDPHEFGNACGVDGVRFAVDASRDLPLRFVVLAPSCVPSMPGLERSGADFGAGQVRRVLSWPEIGGLGEVMDMEGVVHRDERMAGVVQAGLESGKLVCGHARGLGGADLQAYVSSGVASDHELSSGRDLVEKLRAGLTVELRGSHDHLLPEFVEELVRLGKVPQTLTVCTDDVFPDDLLASGGVDDVLRRLMARGLDPMEALRAATLNAATRLGRHDLGLVAPGRRADIAVFGSLEGLDAANVYRDGVLVANNGEIRGAVPQAEVPSKMLDTVRTGRFSAADFKIAANGASVRMATIDNPRFTRWGETEARVVDGHVQRPKDCVIMGVANRYGEPGGMQVALLRNWGNWDGAFATTVSHDSHNLTVFGDNGSDMSIAANEVVAMGGGLAVSSQGRIIAKLALPVAGLVSTAGLIKVATGFSAVRRAMDKVVRWEPPHLVFKACFGASLACNLGPHLTDIGVVDRGTKVAGPKTVAARPKP